MELRDRNQLRRWQLTLTLLAIVSLVMSFLFIIGGTVRACSGRGSPVWPGLFYVVLGVLALGLFFSTVVFAGRLRLKEGRCLECGYDVRHSPDRCPECGTTRRS